MLDVYIERPGGLEEYLQTKASWYPIEFIEKLNDPLVDILYGD